MTPARRDGLILVAILTLAAVLRFVGLPGRGQWDDDQGIEMLTMLLWVRDGQVPLLGPMSSLGTAHHGAAFYWILAPSAFLTDADPVAAAATIAVLGVAGVAATWWLGRTVAGALAGHVAGLLMAVSPSAISSSTFVWNSNVVAPFAALAAAAAWHAWRTRRARWWLLAAVATVLMVHGHLLAAIGVPPLAALLVTDIYRRPPAERPKMLAPLFGAVAIIAAGYVPTLIHDVRHGFTETAALAHFFTEGGAAEGPSLVLRPLIILWRILVWPVSGSWPAGIITAAALVIVVTGKDGIARQFGRWAVGTVVWAVLVLTFVSPSLAEFFDGLPRDQYHAWLAPIIFAVIAVAIARLGKVLAATAVVACLALSAVAMPPLNSADGGWPKAADSAARIGTMAGGKPIATIGVAKSGAALGFPLWRQGSPNYSPSNAEILVVTCDRLFEPSIGIPCGGPAELAVARQVGFPAARLVDKFDDGPRRAVCVFSR